MDSRLHWEGVYQTKSPEQTSWHQPHLKTSLEWIADVAPARSAAIIDVGGGESTIPDDLLALGYCNITVLDIAEGALRKSQARLGSAAKHVRWIAGDVTQVALSLRGYDLWHDRAVFHFLTESTGRAAYVRQLASALKSGGHALIATFGPNGPERCSGLVTNRYDAAALARELGPDFLLQKSSLVDHLTPFGTAQQFLYCDFIRK
jgi:SAM-dependent methyltransferase